MIAIAKHRLFHDSMHLVHDLCFVEIYMFSVLTSHQD
jgi:hypothetical protein